MTLPNEEPRNPYAAPATDLGTVVANYGSGDITQDHAEAIRRAHIGHEASVRSVGLLYLLGGVLGIFNLVGSAISLVSQVGDGKITTAPVAIGLVILTGMTAIQLALGVGLRRLRHWAQIGAAIMTGLALLLLAFGSVVSLVTGGVGFVEVIILTMMAAIPAYILWLLVGEKGRMVFSLEYQAIREMTPEIKYRTSIIVKICVGLLVALILIGLAFAFFGGNVA